MTKRTVPRIPKRKPTAKPEPLVPVAAKPAVAPTVEPKPDNPRDVGVDFNATGAYEYVAAPGGAPHERVITVNGVSVELVGQDAHGRSLYRRM